MIQWIKDSFDKEKSEFERTIKHYADPSQIKEMTQYLKSIYDKSTISELSDQQWSKLKNTGSWNVKSMSDLLKNLRKDNVRRDVLRLCGQFLGPGVINDFSGKVSCPIILQLDDKSLELVAGNTRLTMARIFGVRPKVVIIKTDW